MPTNEHFEAIRALRQEAEALCAACVALAGTSTFLHMAFDPGILPELSRAEECLVGKLRLVQ